MEKIFATILLGLSVSGILNSQSLSMLPLQDFLNNHVTTTSVTFSPDSRYMLIGGFSKIFDISDLTGAPVMLRTIGKDEETMDDLAYDVTAGSDNQSFVLVKNRRIEIWKIGEAATGKPVSIIRDKDLAINSVCFTTDCKHIIYARDKGEIVLCDITGSPCKLIAVTEGAGLSSLAISPDGRSLLAGTRKGELISVDTGTGATKKCSQRLDDEIMHIRFSADGRYVAASDSKGGIWLGNYPSFSGIRSWDAGTGPAGAISFHPTGSFLASGGRDGRIRIWSIPGGEEVFSCEAHRKAVVSLAFSPKGSHLASGSVNAALAIAGEDTRLWEFTWPKKNEDKQLSSSEALTGSNKPSDPVKTGEKRLALVVGNGNYLYSVLANPENDARSMKSALETCGFDVILSENQGYASMQKIIQDFGVRLKNYDIGAVFYAGHGIQINGYNYLIPVDAGLKSEEQVVNECISTDRILEVMKSAGTRINIIMLDACRNNPFERNLRRLKAERGLFEVVSEKRKAEVKNRLPVRQAGGSGLAAMTPSNGSFIAYAADRDETASDGNGNNGLWTSAILDNIITPDITIEEMFHRVARRLLESGAAQTPYIYSSLTESFYFLKSRH